MEQIVKRTKLYLFDIDGMLLFKIYAIHYFSQRVFPPFFTKRFKTSLRGASACEESRFQTATQILRVALYPGSYNVMFLLCA